MSEVSAAIIRDQAILLKRSAAAGRGKTLTFLTKNSGRLHLYYRIFPNRRIREFYEPLQVGELLFTLPTDNAPGRLRSFSCDRIWKRTRGDFHCLVQALFMAELARLASTEGEPQPEIFQLLFLFLNSLEEGGSPETLRSIYQLRLLGESGFLPDLDHCASCRKPVHTRGVLLSFRSGSVYCNDCRSAAEGKTAILTGGALGFLRKAITMSDDRIGRLRSAPALLEEITMVLDHLVEQFFEIRPKTADFVRKMKAYNKDGKIPR